MQVLTHSNYTFLNSLKNMLLMIYDTSNDEKKGGGGIQIYVNV